MAETVTPESLSHAALDNAPEPTVSLPNAASGIPSPAPEKKQETPKFDSLGRAFDPNKFLPKCDTMGRWIVKRKAKVNTPQQAEIPEIAPGEVPPGDPQPQPAVEAHATMVPGARAAAEGVVVMMYTVGALVIDGEEWMPEAGEHEPLVQAWESYFKTTGQKEMPPWMTPAMATAIFMGKRLAKPKTRTFFEKIKAWLFSTWLNRKGRQQSADLARRMEPSVSKTQN